MNVTATYYAPEGSIQSIRIVKEPNSSIIALQACLFLEPSSNPQPVALDTRVGLLAFQIDVTPNHSKDGRKWDFLVGNNLLSWSQSHTWERDWFLVCSAFRCHVIFCYSCRRFSSQGMVTKCKCVYHWNVGLVRLRVTRTRNTKSQLQTSSSSLVQTRKQLQQSYLLTVLIS